MRFVTLFPQAENVHLIKDVGMIPYIMQMSYGYQATLACYGQGDYSYLRSEVQGLTIDRISKFTGNICLDGCLYILANYKNIDVLHIFHLNLRSLAWIPLFKFLNPQGLIYLKLDADSSDIKNCKFNPNNLKHRAKEWILRQCTLISVETTRLHHQIKKTWPVPVRYIPNGFYDWGERKPVKYDTKTNVICTVGRIGSDQKATEILLEAFRIASEHIPEWKVRITGPIEHSFIAHIDKYFKDNPHLRERILFIGPVSDRNLLRQEYKQSKIFCLTSRWEGFALVFAEAMQNGCYIITSDVEPAPDVTDHGKYGDVFPIDDSRSLADILVKRCSNETNLKETCSNIQNYAYQKFYWVSICGEINEYLKNQNLTENHIEK